MTVTAPRGPRTLGLVCAGLLASAAALWGASVAVWFRTGAAGGRAVDVTGAEASPIVGGVALLALAGVAGVLATSGILRRAVGLVLAAAGAGVGTLGVLAFVTDRGTVGQVGGMTPAPLLAVLGGLLVLVAGVVALVGERRLPRFGARYAAPGRRPPPDPDRAAWQDMDAGRDPTDPDRCATGPDDPDGGSPNRAG